MHFIRHFSIGTRLGLGFGLLLVLMAAALGLSGLRFQDTSQTLHRIVDEDWA